MAFNLKAEEIHEKMLQVQRDEFSLKGTIGNTDKLLDDSRDNKAPEKTQEDSLDKARKSTFVPDNTTEGQLDHHKVEAELPARTGKDRHDQLPINLLNEIRDKEKAKAFDKFNTVDAKTEFWDRVLGVEAPQSQLHSDPERFKSLTEKSVLENRNVRKMVMASLQDADAMVYYIYHQAATEKRPVSTSEQSLIDGIAAAKEQLITKALTEDGNI
jgi:hypothetical protein